MEILGWICTALVLIGYYLNSRGILYPALIVWIIGDIGWIVYDVHIANLSHAVLSATIILLNLSGVWRILRKKLYDNRTKA